ncbi:DUF2321 domain-containing protein [Haloactinopolyspora alba]|uniref:DUF2321 domain-containing protein n=1 Tax=Haloactinopolyspora alba TaxID=648780 RepID=UPI0013EA44B6|nr:DUF2321 domain-containing protein [Haloactinopolyspora alba]
MSEIKWPAAEQEGARRGGSFYLGAAVCKRGHVETVDLEPGGPVTVSDACPSCGARMLTACRSCGVRIRGDQFVPGVVSFSTPRRPSFCDGCGAAMPWATRQERIHELENLLDEAEEIDEADLVVIQDHLERLRESSLSERDEKAAWSEVKRRSGDALRSERVSNVLEGLVTAAIRAQLNL